METCELHRRLLASLSCSLYLGERCAGSCLLLSDFPQIACIFSSSLSPHSGPRFHLLQVRVPFFLFFFCCCCFLVISIAVLNYAPRTPLSCECAGACGSPFYGFGPPPFTLPFCCPLSLSFFARSLTLLPSTSLYCSVSP